MRTTLGPRGMDKLMHTERAVTISNDGATIMKTLDIVHPAAKTLVDISLAQDAEVGGWVGGGVAAPALTRLSCSVTHAPIVASGDGTTTRGAAGGRVSQGLLRPHRLSLPPPCLLFDVCRWATAPPRWCCWQPSSSRPASLLWRRGCTRR